MLQTNLFRSWQDVILEWKKLNERIVREKLGWRCIEEDFLKILSELDILRRNDKIPEGKYRQKGNYFKDTIIALVKSRCNYELKERELPGKTDVHRVDLSYIHRENDPLAGLILLAGEVKAMGSPEHRRNGKKFPERTLTIDIDKRIKEVKYTSIDLKRLTDPEVSSGWTEFIATTRPGFFNAWLMRLAKKDRIDHIFKKMEGVTEYTNGVGILVYKEVSEEQYEWIKEIPKPLLSIEELIDRICNYLGDNT